MENLFLLLYAERKMLRKIVFGYLGSFEKKTIFTKHLIKLEANVKDSRLLAEIGFEKNSQNFQKFSQVFF